MNVNEYIWRLPKNKGEWHSVLDVLSGDASRGNYNLIDSDSYGIASGLLSSLANPSDRNISQQINSGDNFSYMSTYYFTNS
jgi:hypothetical protein